MKRQRESTAHRAPFSRLIDPRGGVADPVGLGVEAAARRVTAREAEAQPGQVVVGEAKAPAHGRADLRGVGLGHVVLIPRRAQVDAVVEAARRPADPVHVLRVVRHGRAAELAERVRRRWVLHRVEAVVGRRAVAVERDRRPAGSRPDLRADYYRVRVRRRGARAGGGRARRRRGGGGRRLRRCGCARAV